MNWGWRGSKSYAAIMGGSILSAVALVAVDWPIAKLTSALLLAVMLPGYAFLFLVGPEPRPPLETLTYSFAFGILLAVIVGYVLNFTSVGIRSTPLTVSFLIVTFVLATLGLIRRLIARN